MTADSRAEQKPVLAALPRITGQLNRIFTILLLGGLAVWLLINFVKAPDQFLSVTLVGITQGAIYALVALGYTLVYGIIELINFAHGDTFMLGSFASLTLIGLTGINKNTPIGQRALTLLGILVVVMCFTAFLNYSIEKIAYRRLRNAPRLAPLISAIGVSFILQNVGLLWGKLAWHYGDYGALVGLVVFIVIMAVGLWGIAVLNERTNVPNGAARATLWIVPICLLAAIAVGALNFTRNSIIPPGSPAAAFELGDFLCDLCFEFC